MIALFSRIPRPVAFWLAGFFCGSVALFMWAYTFALVVKITFYSLPSTLFETSLAGAVCALAFPLFGLGFRFYVAGYNSIKP